MYFFHVFDNDMRVVKTLHAANSQKAIQIARRPWLPNPIVENTTLMLQKDPQHKVTKPLEFELRPASFKRQQQERDSFSY